jgi:hypothetical protein
MSKHKPSWKKRPEEGDYTASLNYLSLQFTTATAKRFVKRARQRSPIEHVAKDILRASRLPLLPANELHVADNLRKIRKGKPLSPIILIQGDLTKMRPFVIADGYHRLCAACYADEDAPVAAIMVEF